MHFTGLNVGILNWKPLASSSIIENIIKHWSLIEAW